MRIIDTVRQGTAKRFEYGKHDPPVLREDGQSGHIVENAIRLGILLDIEIVHVEHPDQGDGGQVGRRQESLQSLSRIFIEDIQFEILLADIVGANVIDVLHHQVPQGDIHPLGDALQHLDEQNIGLLLIVRHIIGEFTHLIVAAVVGEFIADPQDILRFQVRRDGDEAQLGHVGIQGILRRSQQAGGDLLEVTGLLHLKLAGGQGGDRAFQGPAVRIGPDQVEEGIRVVGGQFPAEDVAVHRTGLAIQVGRIRVGEAIILANVCHGNNVPDVLGLVPVVGHPHLNTGHLEQAVDLGQIAQRLFKGRPVIMGQEEVAVLIVLVGLDLKILDLGPTLDGQLLPVRLLLGSQGCQAQITEFQLGLDPEEGLASLDQVAAQGQADVTGLDLLDNIVLAELMTVVIQFDPVVKAEGRLVVEAGGQVELLADLTGDIHLDTHPKIKSALQALADR